MKKLSIILIILLSLNDAAYSQIKFINSKVESYVKKVLSNFDSISGDRKKDLEKIANWIATKSKVNDKTEITIICTHNSRRSHFGQVWLQIAARYYGFTKIYVYSGGTEATALNQRALNALKRTGLKIEKIGNDKQNPKFNLYYSKNENPVLLYSKRYDDIQNPKNGFAAIMVCSQADEACPNVPGADVKFAIPYEDPKASDNTPYETARYDETCLKIASEMFYIMYKVKQLYKP